MQPKRGEELPQSRLTAADIRGIRLAVFEGASPSEVAKWYGISRIHVWRIANRKAWKHVPVAAPQFGV
jgi:DNA invertase Pin-like site-specific DNA recombinase